MHGNKGCLQPWKKGAIDTKTPLEDVILF